MKKVKIIIVDDEPEMLAVCRETLEELDNVDIQVFPRGLDAVQEIRQNTFDLLITDINMPVITGVDLLRIVREVDAKIPVLLMTGFPTIDTAVQALRLGATDYLTKPFHPDELLAISERLLHEVKLEFENQLLARQLDRGFFFNEMVGTSHKIREVFKLIDQVAPSGAPVLIHGETGTGKELAARAIHKLSPRNNSRFVPVDCGAIPQGLMESEFFGHEKGAFTGADSRAIGLLEYSDNGTLFLDEVAELPLLLQAKLLRALQEGAFRRVGGNSEISSDLRVVAATNQNLESLVKNGKFREDLYYRLNVVELNIPPLRERLGDIPLLAKHFLSVFGKDYETAVETIDADALEVLSHYHWPGNVRELQNVIKRAVALSANQSISLSDLPEKIILGLHKSANHERGFNFERQQCIQAFESKYLEEILDACKGNVAKAAKQAGIPRGTLYRMLKRSRLDPADYREK